MQSKGLDKLIIPRKRAINELSDAVIKRGDLDLVPELDAPLIQSIERYGVVYPIIINRDNVVLDGVRRVVAARLLFGDKYKIPTITINDEDASILFDASQAGLFGVTSDIHQKIINNIVAPIIQSNNYGTHQYILNTDETITTLTNLGIQLDNVIKSYLYVFYRI